MVCDVCICVRPKPHVDNDDNEDGSDEYCVDVSPAHHSVSVKTNAKKDVWAHFGHFTHVFSMDETTAQVYATAVRPHTTAFLHSNESCRYYVCYIIDIERLFVIDAGTSIECGLVWDHVCICLLLFPGNNSRQMHT